MALFYVLDFFGSLPDKRPECKEPLAFEQLVDALDKISELFIPEITITELLPNDPSDRIIVWECNTRSNKVNLVWAYNPFEDIPGADDVDDKILVPASRNRETWVSFSQLIDEAGITEKWHTLSPHDIH